MGARVEGPLADAVAACGADPGLVEVEWDDLCQEDVLTFSGPLPERTLARLAELYLTFPSRFVFATGELQVAFERLVPKLPTMVRLMDQHHQELRERLNARGLTGFQPFDRDRETLGAFASRAEIACGFGEGEILSVGGDNGIVLKSDRLRDPQTRNVATLLALLILFAPDVELSLTGLAPD